MRISICFKSNSFPEKNFKWGALMRPSWSKQLSVPCNNFNDSFLLVLFKHFTGFQNLQKHSINFSRRALRTTETIPWTKWKRDWQGVRLKNHCWTISSSPYVMTKIFNPNSTLNPPKLSRLQFILLEPAMIVSYWRSLLVTPDFPLGSSILNIPLHCHGMRKRISIQLQYARQYLFQIQFLSEKSFKWGALMRPSWSKQLSVPCICNNCNDSFLLVLI